MRKHLDMHQADLLLFRSVGRSLDSSLLAHQNTARLGSPLVYTACHPLLQRSRLTLESWVCVPDPTFRSHAGEGVQGDLSSPESLAATLAVYPQYWLAA